MSVEALEGRRFGARPYRLCAEKSAEFVAVTGDDPNRWGGAAPPGFAAALLFVVAPELLSDPLVSGAVVHGDQSFHWHRSLKMETEVEVKGMVERVRVRAGRAFVTFLHRAEAGSGLLVEGRSTFVVGEGASPADEVTEVPGPLERGVTEPVGGQLPSPRSASRRDLVRYAAATRDWNPIHWDQSSAIAAGLPGVVVHGLLQSAWLTQIACGARVESERPLASAKFRYRAPLRAADSAIVEGSIGDTAADLQLSAGGQVTVSGRLEFTS